MTITIRLQANTQGQGELAGEIHDLDLDHLPERVQHHLDAHHREDYDLRWGGDVVRKDGAGYVIYGYMGVHGSTPMELEEPKHPQVGEETRYRRPPSQSELHAESERVTDEEAGISPEDISADDPTG